MDMCAIAGVLRIPANPEILSHMLQTMKRRGPDEEGTYVSDQSALLHRRLTIVDPDGGKQPMLLSHGGECYVMVYNGELYNTEELRIQLQNLGHRFQGRSDTEVVLHAYAQWGEASLSRMNGIFALAIWEQQKKELFLARDRMGVKPLFFKLHAGGLLFASEIKTILAYPCVKAELDADGVAELLLLGPGRTPGNGVFRGVQEIEPGCYGRYKEGRLVQTRYWMLRDRTHADSFTETAEKVRELVIDSIRRQTVSDFPVGTFLSGGLDSSIISTVCAAHQRNGEPLYTFSLDYQNNAQYFIPEKFQPDTDTAYIGVMCNHLQSKQHWTVLTTEELFGALEEATVARDLPGLADVDFSLLLFCRNIAGHVKVALSGECADEIFGGYPWFRDPQIRDAEGFPWAQNTKYRASFLPGWVRDKLIPSEFVHDRYEQTILDSDILPENAPLERRMKQMVNLNQRWFMQTLLDRKDRMSMYSGLEVRVPFCDYRIAEYMYGVPWEFKDYHGREKGLLRYAMRDLLPREILYRKKSPYPKTYDPAYLDMVQQAMQQVLDDPLSPILQIVSREALENLMVAEYSWPWYGQLMRVPQTIAYMLQLNVWLKAYKVQIV